MAQSVHTQHHCIRLQVSMAQPFGVQKGCTYRVTNIAQAGSIHGHCTHF